MGLSIKKVVKNQALWERNKNQKQTKNMHTEYPARTSEL